MNLVGKIFTVLIFLMCVVFGTFALMVHAAHKNWREVVVAKGGLDDQLKDAAKQKKDLEDEKKILETTLENERKQTRDRLIALEQAKNDAVAKSKDDDETIHLLETKSRTLAMAIDEVHKTLGVLQTEIEGLRMQKQLALDQRNDLETKLVAATDKVMTTVAERDRLEKLQRNWPPKSLSFSQLSAVTRSL